MEEIRYHETNAGRESKQSFWIFEGMNVIWLLVGFGLSFIIANRLINSGWGLFTAVAISSAPSIGSVFYVAILKYGKPKSFDVDLFVWLAWKFRFLLDHLGALRTRPYFTASRHPSTPHPLAESHDAETS